MNSKSLVILFLCNHFFFPSRKSEFLGLHLISKLLSNIVHRQHATGNFFILPVCKLVIYGWWNLYCLFCTNPLIFFLIFRKCLRFCFMDLLQEDLDRVVTNWNNHTIRATRSAECPHGIPNILYLLAGENGNGTWHDLWFTRINAGFLPALQGMIFALISNVSFQRKNDRKK